MSTNFTIDCINKIKGENWSQFETSIFSDEYQKANELLKQIIEANEKLDKRDELEVFCNENQIVNVISFLGERGMGKSSAMLSFAFYLKNYSGCSIPENHPYYLKKKDELYFSVLSKIDVAMMMQGEKLFDVILAKMWNEYLEAAERQAPDYDFVWREMASQFNEVKNAYTRYVAVLNKHDNIKEIKKYTELSNLAQSLTLRKSFEKLVDLYLRYKKSKQAEAFLVIPIDDLDMIMENVHDKLEEVRFLLSVPKVIVLLTADVNRMALILNGQFSAEFLCDKNIIEAEKESVRGYVTNYLSKVLPRNMRIYMPTFRGVENNKIFIDISRYADKIDLKLCNTYLESDRLQLIFIRRVFKIMVYPEKNNYVLRSNSLRNQVNSTYELLDIMSEEKDKQYQLAYRWLHKELNIGYTEVTVNNYATIIRLLLECSDKSINGIIGHFSVEDDYYFDNSGITYGAMISRMLVMENMWPTDIIGKNLVQWILSLAISNAIIKMPGSVESCFIKKDIFSSVIPRSARITEQTMNVNEAFVLKLKCDNSFKQMIKRDENRYEILRTFRALMFYDMSEIFSGNVLTRVNSTKNSNSSSKSNSSSNTNSNSNTSDNSLIFRSKVISSKTSVDNLFYNILQLDRYWNQYTKLVYDAIFQDKTKVDYDEFMNGFEFSAYEYNQWKEKYAIEYLWDILPVQNVSIMKEIASRIIKIYTDIRSAVFVQSNFQEIIIREVIEVFKESENYYTDDSEDTIQFSYAQKFEDLLSLGIYSDIGDKIKSIVQQTEKDSSM